MTDREPIPDDDRPPDHCPACAVVGSAGADSGTRYCLNPECATIEFVSDDDAPDAHRERIAAASAIERGESPVAIAARSSWRDLSGDEAGGEPLAIVGFERREDANAWGMTAERNRLIRAGWSIEAPEDD